MLVFNFCCFVLKLTFSSKRANDRVSEAKYPVLCGGDSPVVLGKIKRIKSMQPKPLEDEITKSLGEQLSCATENIIFQTA